MKKVCIIRLLIINTLFAIMIQNLTGCITKNDVGNFNASSIDIDTAYTIALTEAKKWDTNAETYLATSTDSNYEDIDQGKDGTRSAWTFVFVVRNTDKCYNVFIQDGKIHHTQEVFSAYNEDLILPNEQLKISSKEAINIVRSKAHLLPSVGWAVGYHFSLKNIDGKLGLMVSGSDINGQRVSLNACQLEDNSNYLLDEKLDEKNVESVASEQSDILCQNYVFDQNATAYVSVQGAKTASGKTAKIGMVAVHPNTYSSNASIAVKSGPVIPFGTVITINSSFSELQYVTFPGSAKQYTQFVVEDLGQLNHQEGYSPWWIDIYFGVNNATNTKAALEFGKGHTISYTYWAPIDS